MRDILRTQNAKAIGLTAAAWGHDLDKAVVTVGLPDRP